jgi:hypothetical protein
MRTKLDIYVFIEILQNICVVENLVSIRCVIDICEYSNEL